eukprot:6482185-Amphidinium_carterae.5
MANLHNTLKAPEPVDLERMTCLWSQMQASEAKLPAPLASKPFEEKIEVNKRKAMKEANQSLESANNTASTACCQWKTELKADASFEQVLAVAEKAGLLKETVAADVNAAKKKLTEACLFANAWTLESNILETQDSRKSS